MTLHIKRRCAFCDELAEFFCFVEDNRKVLFCSTHIPKYITDDPKDFLRMRPIAELKE